MLQVLAGSRSVLMATPLLWNEVARDACICSLGEVARRRSAAVWLGTGASGRLGNSFSQAKRQPTRLIQHNSLFQTQYYNTFSLQHQPTKAHYHTLQTRAVLQSWRSARSTPTQYVQSPHRLETSRLELYQCNDTDTRTTGKPAHHSHLRCCQGQQPRPRVRSHRARQGCERGVQEAQHARKSSHIRGR
jgi:hypothetical protein